MYRPERRLSNRKPLPLEIITSALIEGLEYGLSVRYISSNFNKANYFELE